MNNILTTRRLQEKVIMVFQQMLMFFKACCSISFVALKKIAKQKKLKNKSKFEMVFNFL